MRRLVLLILVCLSVTVGCKKDPDGPATVPQCSVQCTNVPVRVTFSATNYTPQDIDTVVVKMFAPDSTFTTAISTTTYHLTDTVHYTEATTLNLGTGFNGLELSGQHDYEISLPGQTIRISNIEEPNVTEQHACSDNATCAKIISKFSLTGGLYQLLAFEDSPLYLQLK